MKKLIGIGQIIFLMFIMLLIVGGPVAASQDLLPIASFTVRDYGSSGIFYDDTDDFGGFYGYLSYPPLFNGEHFVEFDISGIGLATQVVFDFNISNITTEVGLSDSKDFRIAYYSGTTATGSANISVFGSGTWLDDYTISSLGTENFAVDVTSVYNSFAGSSTNNYLGFRIYEPVWTDSPSTGNQLRYEDSALSVTTIPVVPEPISSILFLVGGSTLAARRFMRRKKIDRQ